MPLSDLPTLRRRSEVRHARSGSVAYAAPALHWQRCHRAKCCTSAKPYYSSSFTAKPVGRTGFGNYL
jgi:hypothetical protein